MLRSLNELKEMKDAITQNWDWVFLMKAYYLKIKEMAHVFHRDPYHDNKQHIRDMWKTTRPLKKMLNNSYWPHKLKLNNGKIEVEYTNNDQWPYHMYIWLDENDNDTKVRTPIDDALYQQLNNDYETHLYRNIMTAEDEFCKMQMKEFGDCLGKYVRNWWC